MTTFATDPGARMRAKGQRARGPHAAVASVSPPGLGEAPLPPIAATGQSCPVGEVGGDISSTEIAHGGELNDWIDRWQDYLLRIEGKATFTSKNYAAWVRNMVRDVEIGSVEEVTRQAIERHLKRRSFVGVGPARIAGSIIAIRRFCQYLQVNGRIPANPALGIATPKTYRKAMKVLTVPEVRRLLFGEGDGKLPRSRAELMAVAMFCVQYGGALRPAELGQILTSDVEWLDEERMFLVRLRRTKHAREDVVQRIGVDPSRYLGAYLQIRPDLERGPYLFPFKGGRPTSADMVRKKFTLLCKARGIEAKGRQLVPKLLRTTRCTHLLDAGAPIRHVQAFMRHRSMETTAAHYAYTDDQRVGRMLAKHDPLGKKKRATLPMQGALKAMFGGFAGLGG